MQNVCKGKRLRSKNAAGMRRHIFEDMYKYKRTGRKKIKLSGIHDNIEYLNNIGVYEGHSNA